MPVVIYHGTVVSYGCIFFIFDTMDTSTRPPVKHLGKKIGRIREMLGMKQETLAEKMGISQQSISKMEQNETIDDATLERVAKALGLSSEVIRNFTEEGALNVIANTFNSHENSVSIGYQSTFNFNPIDKWIEAIEENKKLYEALLNAEREKVALLERMLEKKK
jgi:transcriptional regulator with XRE-family HTH domain